MIRIERVVTSGVFALDGQEWDVDNNVWIVGDDEEVLVIDAAHDHRPIVEVVTGRRVTAIVLTHGHNDHVNAGPALADGVVFSGDTLFQGGPGATGRSFSDFPTIIASIEQRLLTLPPDTVVHTGHGESTTIGNEAPHLDDWVARGH